MQHDATYILRVQATHILENSAETSNLNDSHRKQPKLKRCPSVLLSEVLHESAWPAAWPAASSSITLVQASGAQTLPRFLCSSESGLWKSVLPPLFLFWGNHRRKLEVGTLRDPRSNRTENQHCFCQFQTNKNSWFSYLHVTCRLTKQCGNYGTGSAAQGGGGSFKNRKPIGEVGCCESRMAERICIDGPKGGWNCVFGVVAMVAVVTSPTTAGCSVV